MKLIPRFQNKMKVPVCLNSFKWLILSLEISTGLSRSQSHSHSHSHSRPHSHGHSHTHGQSNTSYRKKYKPTDFDMDKLRSTLKQFVRDWSEEVLNLTSSTRPLSLIPEL